MAGRIPQSFINDLLSRADIVNVVDGRVTLKRAGKDYSGLCPFHDEKTPSFTVVPEKQFYHCFGCGANGTALTFLMEYENLDFVSAVEMLAADLGLEVPRERGRGRDRREDAELYDVLERAERFFRAQLKQADGERAVAYLKRRGLTGITARDFGIGYAPAGWDGLKQHLNLVKESCLVEAGLIIEGKGGRTYDRFRDRIMFPIRDTRGRVIGFGGRVLDDENEPKYLNSPETPVFHKGRELYGLYEARRAVRRLERLIVVEGYMDVVALAEAGFANAVASLGTATSNAQFEKLFRLVPEVICCFDGDRAGREAAWKALIAALPTLKAGRQLKFVFLPEGDDPDSLVRSEGQRSFETRLKGAVTGGEYLFQRLSQGMDLGSMDGRARLVELALPHVSTVPDGALRELMLARLAEIAHLPRESLAQNPSPAPASTGRRQVMTREASRLSARLLSMLLQHPEFAAGLDEERKNELLTLDDSAVVTTLRFLEEHPDTDTTALLGYWAGRAESEAVVALADTPLILDPTALESEFSDAVDQFLAAVRRADRRALVRNLGESGSAEDLARYWALKQNKGQ